MLAGVQHVSNRNIAQPLSCLTRQYSGVELDTLHTFNHTTPFIGIERVVDAWFVVGGWVDRWVVGLIVSHGEMDEAFKADEEDIESK